MHVPIGFSKQSHNTKHIVTPNGDIKSCEDMGGILAKLGTWGTTLLPNEFGNMLVPSNVSGIGGREPGGIGERLLELELELELELKLLLDVAMEVDLETGLKKEC